MVTSSVPHCLGGTKQPYQVETDFYASELVGERESYSFYR